MYSIGPFRIDVSQYPASAAHPQKGPVDVDASQGDFANVFPGDDLDARAVSAPYKHVPEAGTALAPRKPRLTPEENLRIKHALKHRTALAPKGFLPPHTHASGANTDPPKGPLGNNAAPATAETFQWTRNGIVIQSDLRLYDALHFKSADADETRLFSAHIEGKTFADGPLRFFKLASAKHGDHTTQVSDAPMKLPIARWHLICSARQAVQLAFDRELDHEHTLVDITLEGLHVVAAVQMVKRLVGLQPVPFHASFEGTINGRDISCNILQLQRLIGPLAAGQTLDASWATAKIAGNELQAPGHLVRELLKAPPAGI